jgi:hypothetical protein
LTERICLNLKLWLKGRNFIFWYWPTRSFNFHPPFPFDSELTLYANINYAIYIYFLLSCKVDFHLF